MNKKEAINLMKKIDLSEKKYINIAEYTLKQIWRLTRAMAKIKREH